MFRIKKYVGIQNIWMQADYDLSDYSKRFRILRIYEDYGSVYVAVQRHWNHTGTYRYAFY